MKWDKINCHCKQINPAAALQYGVPSWKQVANRCTDPSNSVESKKKSTFLILPVQSLLPTFPRTLWTWRGTSGQVRDHHTAWLTTLCLGKWYEAAHANGSGRDSQHCPPQGECSLQLCTAPYLISHLLTHMNTSNLNNKCFIEPGGQALSMYFSALIGSMLQIIIGLLPHSIKSASKKKFLCSSQLK